MTTSDGPGDAPPVSRAGAVTATRSRTEGGFDAFFAAHQRDVTALVLALRGNRVGAEDVVQEAFVRAYRRWDTVGRMDRPDAWVRRVALNLATSRWRRLVSEVRVSVRLTGDARTGETASPFDAVDGADAFWRAVRSLAPHQAQVVAMHYAGDRTVAEIAADLEIAEGTVKATLHQARRRLAEQLRAETADRDTAHAERATSRGDTAGDRTAEDDR